MTKAKNTKRALLAAVLALIVSVSMLIGTTFAWFTDSVSSAGNIIKSGNLKVTLEWMDGTKDVADPDSNEWQDASQTAIFDYSLWEPGYVSVRHIKIGNEGSLALKYMVAIEADGEVSDLQDVIDVYCVDPAVKVTDRTELSDSNKLGTLREVLGKLNSTAYGELAAGDEDMITLALKMQETAGNYYQDMEIGSTFSVKVFATQLDAENDSFGPDYDEGAFLPVVYTAEELREALKAGGNIVVSGTIDADGVLQPFAEYPGETAEYYVLGENVDSLAGGTYTMDESAKYGIYVDTYTSEGGEIALSDMEITANSKWSFVIDNAAGGKVSVSDVDITAQSGAGLYSVGGKVTLDNVNVNHLAFDPAYSDTPWGATALAAAGDTDLTINSGSYYGATYGMYVYSSGGTVTINGGNFKAPVVVAADAQNGAKTYVNINGGNFDGKFESVNVWGTGSEALITINGGNFTNFSTTANKRITIKGGTFDANPTQWVADGHVAVKNADDKWVVSPVVYGNYKTVATADELNAALANATSDITIFLTDDIVGTAEVNQELGSKVIIDGNGFKFDGTLSIDGNSSVAKTESLVIKNINFVADATATTMIQNQYSDNRRYAHNVTIENCKFTATGAAKYGTVGMAFNAPADILVKNCSGSGLHSFIQNKGHTGTNAFVVDGVKLTDCKNGMAFGTNFKVEVKNCEIQSVGNCCYGIRGDGNTAGAYAMTVENCTISADVPVQIRKMTEGTNYTLTVNGDNTFVAGDSNYQIIATSTEYADDVPEVKPCLGTFTLNGADGMTVYQ